MNRRLHSHHEASDRTSDSEVPCSGHDLLRYTLSSRWRLRPGATRKHTGHRARVSFNTCSVIGGTSVLGRSVIIASSFTPPGRKLRANASTRLRPGSGCSLLVVDDRARGLDESRGAYIRLGIDRQIPLLHMLDPAGP